MKRKKNEIETNNGFDIGYKIMIGISAVSI